MKLIIILICLGLERYCLIGQRLKRFNWFESYVEVMRRIMPGSSWLNGLTGLVFLIAPVIIFLALVLLIFGHLLSGLLGFVLTTIILLYCLGPDDLYHQVVSYFNAFKQNDEAAVKRFRGIFLGKRIPKDTAKCHRLMTTAILEQANSRLFAIIFWFILLGPFGILAAATYRCVLLIERVSSSPKSPLKPLLLATHATKGCLNWLPARMTALLYSLMGDFTQSFRYWAKHVWSGIDYNREILTVSATLALHIQSDDNVCATLEENKEALNLVDRALVLSLFLIGLFTLGAWIS